MKPYLSTCPAESNLMWEDVERGRPFFSQFIWAGGVPIAWHSVSNTTIRASGSSLFLLIVGGTKICNQIRKNELHISIYTPLLKWAEIVSKSRWRTYSPSNWFSVLTTNNPSQWALFNGSITTALISLFRIRAILKHSIRGEKITKNLKRIKNHEIGEAAAKPDTMQNIVEKSLLIWT